MNNCVLYAIKGRLSLRTPQSDSLETLAYALGVAPDMRAFISYLHRTFGFKHFFVLEPNLTIYEKLIADFTPNQPL